MVKERFGGKDKLVEQLQKLTTDELWLDEANDVKGLSRVSNAKLLRLHDILSTVKQEFGTRQKLIAAVAELEKRQKDDGYKARLERFSTPHLLDLHRSATKRAGRAAAKPAPKTTPKKKPRSKKAKAKAKAA
jgi:hypothetical protein